MRPLETNAFSTRLVSVEADGAMPVSEIVVNGKHSGKTVAGAILEAALQWSDLTLAFLTDDIPNEDTLRIYLFDNDLTLIDWATLGAMYSTGYFSDLTLAPPDMLTFSFIGGTTWTLQLYSHEILTLPFVSEPTGVSRPFRLHRRFQLTGTPQPASI